MAKLIVTRPRLGSFWEIMNPFNVLIDGSPTARIARGETVVIDLPTGPHQVSARIAGARSQPMLVETTPGETRRLAAGTNVGLRRLMTWSLILSTVPLVGLLVWNAIDSASLLESAKSGTVSSQANRRAWHMALMIPAALLPSMCMLAQVALIRRHGLVVFEVPSPDLTADQIATIMRERPFRVRITVRHLMIAVAISAIFFWISLEVFRNIRASQFRSEARMHAYLEDVFRGFNPAKADFHATMKRKYAEAAARGSFTVAPDPSAPP